MSKNILDQAFNKITISGKLLDVMFREGKLSDGRPYESANMTVRVVQTYGGRTETSEIPVSCFAAKYTLANKPNPAYEQIQQLKRLKTAQNVGIDNADIIRINSGNIRENNFVSRSGQLINGWQINASFIGTGNGPDVATFNIDIFIMDMHPEEDREGNPTGRLIIKGGVVQYNGMLDVLEFVAENPEAVDFMERNWNINDTLNIRGRVRVSVVEEKSAGSSSDWGEDIPQTTTRTTRELVIGKGDDQGRDEEFAYDPVDIKKAFNARKARIEQMQMDVAKRNAPAPTTSSNATKYDWE